MLTARQPTVLIADDCPRVIQAITTILRPAYNIIRVATNGEDAVSWIDRRRPSLAILDVCMPKLDGIAVARKLRQAGIGTRVILMTEIDDEDYIKEARAVAHGYVLKRRILTDLPLAVASAMSGSFFLSH